ncbi:MAG: Spy/CpxP family protein refolding chaperone [bacterium]
MKVFKLFIVAGFFLSGSLFAFAGTENPSAALISTKTPTRHTYHRREILQVLRLTADQRQQIDDCRASYRKKMAELNGQLEVKQVELENELDKAEPDQDKLSDLTQTIGDLLGQRLLERAEAKIKIEKQILTPQQADQLKMLQLETSSDPDDNI